MQEGAVSEDILEKLLLMLLHAWASILVLQLFLHRKCVIMLVI